MTFLAALSEPVALFLVGTIMIVAGVFLRRVLAIFPPAPSKQNSQSQ